LKSKKLKPSKNYFMKKRLPKLNMMIKMIIPAFVLAVLMSACNSTPKTAAMNSNVMPGTDTTGLAQFQQWKAKNELAAMAQFQNMAAPQPATTTIVKYVPVSSTRTRSTSSRSSGGSMSSSSSNTAQASQKKGWSKAAKGAVIGGVGGAAAGAVINKKNRALGAVIGGVIGAAGGYGIGRGMDKKDGRF
jgi:hypothetical protein